jgi:hypothetical protein
MWSYFGVFFLGSSCGIFVAALLAGAVRPLPKLEPQNMSEPNPEPFMSWRIILDEMGIPATVSIEMNAAAEAILSEN